jgi:hypothetical protein
VSKFDVMPADGAFTRKLNTCHLRNSHSPVEVHVSECVTCDQHRCFRANSSKKAWGRVPSRCRNARWVSKFDVMLTGGHLHGFLTSGICGTRTRQQRCTRVNALRAINAGVFGLIPQKWPGDGSPLAFGTRGGCRNLM